MKGKLIVIEGADATGKQTQSNLLVEFLKQKGYKTALFSFPQYGKTLSADLIKKLLKENAFLNANPYLTALPYILDRITVSKEIKTLLSQGYVIVCDRYSQSNFAYNGAKLEKEDREEFIKFLINLEHKEMQVPEADLMIYLDLPYEVSKEMLLKDVQDGKREEIDKLEQSLEFQKKVRETYKLIFKLYKTELINCAPEGKLLPIDSIHKIIVEKVLEFLEPKK